MGRVAAQQMAAARPRDRAAADHRSSLRCRAQFAAALRAGVPPAAAGPGLEWALREGAAAAAELASIPDTPALREAYDALLAGDPAPDALEQLAAKLEALAQ